MSANCLSTRLGSSSSLDLTRRAISIPSLITSTRRLLTISCKRISGYFLKMPVKFWVAGFVLYRQERLL